MATIEQFIKLVLWAFLMIIGLCSIFALISSLANNDHSQMIVGWSGLFVFGSVLRAIAE